ncbi:outer membrane protein [Varunaivibrio sulfuroxidans]|uniref:Outer membrane protein n=2 Tax=Varunaivibrio sulfuroxidans TaxID=1773489 RepID=A0A4R3J7F6_9PROT|nr:outer membrane protein [Varunaivibrio sulfuroxidans]
MYGRLRSVVPVFMAGIFSLSLGVAAHAQTFEETLAAAYRSNPGLLAEQARLRAIDEGVAQARSGWRPSVNATMTTGRAIDDKSATPKVYRDPSTMGVTISQPLYSGGKTVAATAQADNAVYAGRARLSSAEQTVLLNAATAYVNVVRDQAVVDLNINNEQVLKRQLDAAKDRFKVGEITRTDVDQASARLAGATADRIQAEGALETSRANFVSVVGMAPEKLGAPDIEFSLPDSLGEAVKIAAEGNYTVQAAVYDERAARDGVRGVEGDLLPSLSLNGSATRSLNTMSQNYASNSYQAQLVLSVPLYEAGGTYSRLRQARQQASRQRLLIDQARRSATESATSAWETLQTARAQIVSIKSQVNASRTALAGVEREAAVGSRTVLDVLDAEQELLNARVKLVRAQRDATVAIFRLKESMGQLTARNLNLKVDLYDNQGHYREVRGKWVGTSSSGEDNRPVQ